MLVSRAIKEEEKFRALMEAEGEEDGNEFLDNTNQLSSEDDTCEEGGDAENRCC